MCSAIYDSCECGSCANEVEVMFACLFSEVDCGGLQCDAPPPPPTTNPPADPPTRLPVAASPTSDSTACDSERSVYAACIPSEACAQCLDSQFEQALELEEGATCGDLEMGLCAIAPFCNCGCENEAAAFYGCIVDDATEGQCSIDCGSTQPDCDVQINAANTCLSAVNPSCPQCTLDTIEALFGGSETISCAVFESGACAAVYESCECGSCTNEVEVMFACLFSESDCDGLQCDAPQPPPTNPPEEPPVQKTIALAISPTTTNSDAFTFSPTSAPQEDIVGEDNPSPASDAMSVGQFARRVTILGLVVSVVMAL